MRNKIFILFLTLGFIISCENDSSQGSSASITSLENPAPLEFDGDSCPAGYECEDECRELFNVRSEQMSCMDLSMGEVRGLHEALTDKLKTPVGSFGLNSITDEDFGNILYLGARNWSRNAQDYTAQDSQRVLNWLVQKRSYTKSLSESSNQYASRIFPRLIESISPVGGLKPQSFDFLETTRENIILKAERIRNEDALRLFHDYFSRECVYSSYSHFGNRDFQRSACVLGELYCQNGGRKFQEVYPNLLRFDSNLHAFVVNQNGLNLGEDFRDFGLVCRSVCSGTNSCSS